MSTRLKLIATLLALQLVQSATATAQAQTQTQAQEEAQAQIEAEQARRELAIAREEMRKAAERMAEASAAVGDEVRASTLHYFADQNRAVIGVVLDSTMTDRVVINGLSPGGPAEQAGVQVGDEVIAIDNQSLPRGRNARREMIEALRELKVDQEVRLTVLRDDRPLELRVVAARRDPMRMLGGDFGAQWKSLEQLKHLGQLERLEQLQHLGPEIERSVQESLRAAGVDAEMGERIRKRVEQSMNHRSFDWYSSGDDLELAQLNPGLARYFGTDEGVLVLDRKGDDYAALQSGDVLLEVAGKRVHSPRQALQALGARQKGEAFEVSVLRQQRREQLTLTGTGNLLELRSLLPPPPPAPPAPPAAPAPPAPPAPPPPPQFEL